jgi:acyl carrier protein
MQDYQEVLLKLYDMLTPFNAEGLVLTEETALIADLALDSMKVMNLLVMIEDNLDISIPLNILPDIFTIKDLAEHLHNLLREGS